MPLPPLPPIFALRDLWSEGRRRSTRVQGEKREHLGDGGAGRQRKNAKARVGHHVPNLSQPKQCFPALWAGRGCGYGRACPQPVEHSTVATGCQPPCSPRVHRLLKNKTFCPARALVLWTN